MTYRKKQRATSFEFLEFRRLLSGSPPLGDFNGDMVLTASDIDLMSLEIRSANRDLRFDVDGSGDVSPADRQFLVDSIFGTYPGDSNLDGRFTTADLVKVLSAGRYEDQIPNNADWASGDWNGDGEFGTGDLVAALVTGGFEGPERVRPALISVSPADGEAMVNVTRETIIRFSENIDASTITKDSFQVRANGDLVPGSIRVSSTRRFATYFYDSALPASTTVQVMVDGNRIKGENRGVLLDADLDEFVGGIARTTFRTLPLTRISGTNVFGFVKDSMTGEPIVGATIRVDAFPEANVVTDESGRFELFDMPAPEFFVHIDGSTADLPVGFTYPSVGKPFHSVPGQTVQLEMDREVFDVYLPKMALADVQTLSMDEPTIVRMGSQGMSDLATLFPNVDPATWDLIQLTVAPGSALDNSGRPSQSAVIIPVPPDRIPAPLPGFLEPQLVISIQAGAATNFDVPAALTFPNLDQLEPGSRVPIMSFDHDAGVWTSVATGIVSPDGAVIETVAGEGVVAPGWSMIPPKKKVNPCSGSDMEAAQQYRSNCNRAQLEALHDSIRTSTSGYFDFGTETSPLAEGATRVTRNSKYSAQAGYGWTSGDLKMLERIPNDQTTDEYIDFVMTTGAEFVVDVPNGIYEVAISAGDAVARRAHVGVYLEHRLMTSLTTAKSEFQVVRQQVAVFDGQLTAAFFGLTGNQVAINSLTFRRIGLAGSDLLPVEGEVFYAIHDLETDFVIRGRYDTLNQLTDQIVLAPNRNYRISEFHRASLSYGSSEFSTSSLLEGTDALPVTTFLTHVDKDQDLDGLDDQIEFILGTDPSDIDTDNDGITDLAEILQGLNPLDDRAFPTGVVGVLPTGGGAMNVVVTGEPNDPEQLTAYIATATGLSIADVSQFDNPVMLTEFDSIGQVFDVAVDPFRDIVLVAQGTTHSRIDVSNPLQPVVLGTSPIDATNVEISDGVGFIGLDRQLTSVDLFSGDKLGSIFVDSQIVDMAIANERLFVTTRQRLQIFDVSTTEIKPLGSVMLESVGPGLSVGDGVAFITSNGRGGYMTVDVSNPGSPVLVSLSDVEPPFREPSRGIANGSDVALVVGQQTAILLDTSDLNETNVLITRFDLPRQPEAVTIAGGIGYIANGSSGLVVLNYLGFDGDGIAPVVSYDATAIDLDVSTEPIEVQEGSFVTISPDVSDDVQIRSVELLLNQRTVSTDITFPFELPFRVPTGLEPGAGFAIEIRARDTGGNTTTTSPTILTVVPDTIAPELLEVTPRDGQVFGTGQQVVRLEFSESLDVRTVTTDAFVLTGPNGNAIEPRQLVTTLRNRVVQMIFDPLGERGAYQIEINAKVVTDVAGNTLGDVPITGTFELVEGTIFWTGDQDGFWDDPLNWDLGRVPNQDDIVSINVGEEIAVTVRTPVTVRSLKSNEPIRFVGATITINERAEFRNGLTLQSGRLNLLGSTTIGGESEWSGGQLIATGEVEVTGTLTLTSDNTKYLGGVINNTGTVKYDGTNWRLGLSPTPGLLHNLSGGKIEITRAGSISTNLRGSRIINQGELILDIAEELTHRIETPLDTIGGSISVRSGTLNLISADGDNGIKNGSMINVSEQASLILDGTHTVFGDFTGDIQGRLLVGGGLTVPADRIATFNLSGNGLEINGTIAAPGELRNSGTLNLSSGVQKRIGGLLTNSGIVRHTGGQLFLGGANPGIFVNLPDGKLELKSSSAFVGNGGSIINRGEIVIDMENQLTVQQVLFNNEGGTITGQSGTLRLTGGGTHTGGVFNLAEGSAMQFDGTMTGDFTGEILGDLALSTTVPVDSTASINFTENGAMLSGVQVDGILEQNGIANLTSVNAAGELRNSGTLNLSSALQMSIGGLLTNSGLLRHTGGQLNLGGTNPGSIVNQPAGRLELTSTSAIIGNGGGLIINRGEIVIDTQGTLQVQVPLINEGGAINALSSVGFIGSLFNSGTIRVFAGVLLSASVNLEQTDEATISIDVNSANDFGRLSVGQQAKLAGTLQLIVAADAIAAGDQLEFLTYRSIVGEFDTTIADDTTFDVTYGPTATAVAIT